MDPEKEKEIEEEYLSSLLDLNVNSKPLINMLTMLAEENIEKAHVIVRAVEKHLTQVAPEVKLPILYLIDSIVKNVGKKYKQLFAQNIVSMFCGVFEKVPEKVREKMFNLRMTWNEVFPQTKLYALDVKVNVMDNNWPITAKIVPKSVHVNPNFLLNQTPSQVQTQEAQAQARAQEALRAQMKAKERELMELQQKKIELELMVTKKKIADSEKEILGVVGSQMVPQMFGQQPSIPPAMNSGRVRIAPVNSALISSARSRDPRIRARPHPPPSAASAAHMALQQPHMNLNAVVTMPSLSSKSLPKIPKINSSNKTSRDSDRDHRDPRRRKEELKSSSKSPNKDKDRSKSSSKSSSRSNDKKSGSSDDSSPRKRSEEEKKSRSSSHHSRSSNSKSHSSKSPSKASHESKDVDLRVMPEVPDSTTSSINSKDKLLDKLLKGEEIQSSHEMISSNQNEDTLMKPAADVDLRILDSGIKRSMSNEPAEAEPVLKKNRADADTLFGSKDVDFRNFAAATDVKKVKSGKADLAAVRAKLRASKDMSQRGIKILDEFPQMPPSENGRAELMRSFLNRKDKSKDNEATTSENAQDVVPNVAATMAIPAPAAIIQAPVIQSDSAPVLMPVVPEIPIQVPPTGVFAPANTNEVQDLGNLTTAELIQTTSMPASIRKEKRSKWGHATPPYPMVNVRPPMNMPPNMPPQFPQNMLPHHFINPWEQNPLVMAMQAQSQIPFVLPQSTSHPVLNNKLRTLRLDGTKDHLLRFYNETAIIFNDIGEPREIKFSLGQSRVVFDDQFVADLSFNSAYKQIFIEGFMHQIKFGSPTRELYIDNNFYECYFNNQPTQILLNNKLRRVRIEGKAPEVKIGRKRSDLVLGLINIVIDAEMMIPVFLDTSLQYFEFKGQIFQLQFADFFLSVIINNDPFKVEFGGLPKNYVLNGQKHFIRFTGLPDDVYPGRVNMRGMRRTHLFRNCKSPPLIEPMGDFEENADIGQMVENNMREDPPAPMVNPLPGIGQEPTRVPTLNVPNLDINDLLKKLVETGIIVAGTSTEPASVPITKEKSPERPEDNRRNRVVHDDKPKIVPVSLSRPDSLKKRQQAIVDSLYTGLQCSSCGLRFPPEQTMKYSQHLDWHFRQNRRERDSKRRAHFRKWYYNQADWIKYEEIEDLEEREKNFFETQQMESMEQGDDAGPTRGNGTQESTAIVSCAAGPDDVNRVCDMCHDQFEQFYNEETEEWHLRNALKMDDKFYHPICYEDYKASLTLDESGLAADVSKTEDEDGDVEMSDSVVVVKEEKSPMPEKKVEVIPGMEDDEEDDVIVLPVEEPVVTEILDDSEVVENNLEASTTEAGDITPLDDDVILQEPKIETQIVPDDDDNTETPQPSFIVKIKEEPKDNGYELNEEDPFVEVTAIANDDDEVYTNSPFQPAEDENAMFDEASLVPGSPVPTNDDVSRDDEVSRPEGTSAVVSGNKRLKIVLSSFAQNSLSNKNSNISSNVVDQNENSVQSDSINKLETNSVDLQSEASAYREQLTEDPQLEPEIEYQVKPSLKGVKFERHRVPVNRGFENSGLCSIM